MSADGPGIDRRVAIASLIALPLMLEACPDLSRPRTIPAPSSAPAGSDFPANGAYRYDFGGEMAG